MTNRLAQSQSLYLRKHAENPIDWWPWCEEALATARRENKPIFLSIGYSSCHWCTVMEGEAFSNSAIAQYMNTNFLPIKVDREERPDIDSIYMQALQMMTQQGGWPLNIFLSPEDLVPFYGGTYFPVDPRYGRPGFLDVLQAIRRFYDTDKTKLQAIKGEILENLKQTSVLSNVGADLTPEILRKGMEVSSAILSEHYSQNSFPMIPYSDLALRGVRYNLEVRTSSKEICTQRGLDLALGGIYDQVAGGFHRYTVDPNWTVPHFEKMLYDNGQIVEYLANLWALGVKEAAFKRGIQGTVEWLKREMTSPQGYFYAAQDADSFNTPQELEPEEGAFYVWSYEELEKLLTQEEFWEVQEHFTVTSQGNFEGKNVLQRRHPGELSALAETALTTLFKVRYGDFPDAVKTFPPARDNQEAKNYPWPGRIPAVTDTKMIVAWNSLMISGLARAAAVLANSDYLDLATKSANFILENQWVNGRFHRLNYDGNVSVLAQSEDYALFIKALLDLHQASLAISNEFTPEYWLENAVKVQGEFDDYLWCIELGGYYNTSADSSDDLIVKERGYTDNATPAANGVAIASLVRLFLLTEDWEYLEHAQKGLQAFGSMMQEAPQACPSLLSALDWYRHATLIRTTSPQIASLSQQYYPTAIYKLTTDLPENAIALVCQGLSCLEPATTEAQLLEQLQQSQTRE
ncbi:MAG: hypothetical protein RLZZ338_330 [Cyanobacteriota bacterium]|jgi:uncharacterized protein YyaL (SSP411 family)